MTEEQNDNNRKKIGDHYSEFSEDEFKDPYEVGVLCKAIKADHYELKFPNSLLSSVFKLNELLEYKDFFEQVIQKKGNINWSLDINYLIFQTSKDNYNKTSFSKLSQNEQIDIKRLNRLLLEEAYPRETPKSSKYFIPLGLSSSVSTFENHYKVADGEPILIIGQTGVGKSLFLHIFEKLYREEHKDEKKYPIIKANCAHFGGDPNLVRSELFGHAKGAFTGAIRKKTGLVEMADGGVLILEEIGDLPLETQAILLTFIETGEYYRVGDDRTVTSKSGKKTNQEKDQSPAFIEKDKLFYDGGDKKRTGKSVEKADHKNEQYQGPRKANVQIVGLTNREDNMREDFKYRFFPFYVPPIHKRRMDILHYLYAMFPDLFDSMQPNEIFALITYHWPGNVREIERVGRLLRRRMKGTMFRSGSDQDRFDSFKFYNLDPNNPNESIGVKQVEKFRYDLMKNNIDVELIESILNKYQVGLEGSSNINNTFIVDNCNIFFKETSERYGLRFTYSVNSFANAGMGIIDFCELFYKNPNSSVNLIDLKEDFSFTARVNRSFPNTKDEKDRYQQLIKSIFEYLSGIKLLESDSLAENIFERDEFFTMLGKSNPGNQFLASLGFTEPMQEKETKDFDICSLKVNDLLELYYQKILDRAQGNQKKAAKLAGIVPSSFQYDFNKYVRKVAPKKRKPILKTS
jgi:transcriptional regulator with AAA-type ATPase domain